MTGHQDTILVIEDDRALREGLALNFELHGYQVETAADGEEGMRKAFDIRPDLIVLDIMLPGWSGLDILAELRDRRRDVPVLILSARGTTDNKVEGLNIGDEQFEERWWYRVLSLQLHFRKDGWKEQRWNQGFNELTYPPSPNNPVETVINMLVNSDG